MLDLRSACDACGESGTGKTVKRCGTSVTERTSRVLAFILDRVHTSYKTHDGTAIRPPRDNRSMNADQQNVRAAASSTQRRRNHMYVTMKINKKQVTTFAHAWTHDLGNEIELTKIKRRRRDSQTR